MEKVHRAFRVPAVVSLGILTQYDTLVVFSVYLG